MEGFFFALGVVAALITIGGALASKPVRNAVGKWLPRTSGMRFSHPWSMDDINRAIAGATSQVAVLQTWMPTLNADIGQWEKVGRGVSFRVLLASESIVKERLRYRPHTVPLTDQNLQCLFRFNNRNDARVEVKQYQGLPFGPVYIVDDTVYWGLYLASRDSLVGPRFTCSRRSDVGQMIEQSFEAIWNATDTDVVDDSGTLN